MDFTLLIKDPNSKAKSLVRKITHSGETDLNKENLNELKGICKACKDDLMVIVYKECMKSLHKEHSQVRVTTVKLLEYLFQKSHVIREKLLDDFDTFLELTLAISQKPKIKLKLPPPKKFADLLLELTAKTIHNWHADFGGGYEKLRYAHRFLREHNLVDFSHFQVHTHEQLIKRQKLAERQEKILTRSIENRLKEFQELKPEIEQVLAQIESLLDILVGASESFDSTENYPGLDETGETTSSDYRQHGIANLSQNLEINFSPYVQVERNQSNKDIVQNLKELKKQLVDSKLAKLICIEKVINKKSEQFVSALREIIDLKNKSTNVVLKLGELKIINDLDGTKQKESTLDNVDDSDSDQSEFEDVEPKEDLETYIPKSMRYEYGLEAIDPRELNDSGNVTLTDETFEPESGGACCSNSLQMPCNVKLESGKLCPRRDKLKCPFHGRIIPRDHNGTPLNEEDRLEEESRLKSRKTVPEWQDPELLLDIKHATGIDLTMPKKTKGASTNKSKLANTRTCDLTPKQRLQQRLVKLNK